MSRLVARIAVVPASNKTMVALALANVAKCSTLLARNVDAILKFLSVRLTTNRFTAAIASKQSANLAKQ
jgi:hypothetical protein